MKKLSGKWSEFVSPAKKKLQAEIKAWNARVEAEKQARDGARLAESKTKRRHRRLKVLKITNAHWTLRKDARVKAWMRLTAPYTGHRRS